MAVNTVGADIARNYLRNFGFDTTGLSAQQLADKLHQIEPSEYYEIVGWTPDTQTPAVSLAPVSVFSPPPTPDPVVTSLKIPTVPMSADIARLVLKSRGIGTIGLTAQQLGNKLHEIYSDQYYDVTDWTPEFSSAPTPPPAPPAPPPPAPVPVVTPTPVAVPETQQPAQEFFNPYQPGSYEYEMVEATRGQEPGTGGVVTIAQTPDILRVQQPAPPPGFNTFNQVTSIILSVATIAVPGLNSLIGEAILSSAGITAASEAVTAGVGSAALSAASTVVAGGNAEDVLKNAASAGFASGVNIGLGGGVAGAAAGSAAGTTIRGGNVDQVLTNALAAGVGAGVGGVIGPAAGSIATSLVSTGGVSNQTLFNAALAEINGFNKANNASAPIVEGQKTPTTEQLLTQQILSENQNIGPNVSGIGGDVFNVLAGNIAAQQNLPPEAQSVVDQITLAGAGDPQAFAPALAPLLTPGGAAVASAAAAETAVLLARLAQTPAGQNAIRQAAVVNQNVMSALGTLGAMIGIAPAAFLAGDPLPQAQVQNIATNGVPANFGTFDPGAGTGWDATKAGSTTKATTTTTRPAVDTTSAYPETLLSRYPGTGTTTTTGNPYGAEESTVPVTADVINVAGRLGITIEEATSLAQQSPSLFSQVSGRTGTRDFTPDELDTMRQTDLVAMGIVRGAGNASSPEAINQDFNVIISGTKPDAGVPTIGSTSTLTPPLEPAVVGGTTPSTMTTSFDVINGTKENPIYTKLDAAVKSGVDVYPEITNIASSQRKAGGDYTETINSIMQTANQIGIDPQKAAATAINSWFSTEVSPSIESSTNTTTKPGTELTTKQLLKPLTTTQSTTELTTKPGTELTTKQLLKPLTTTQSTTESTTESTAQPTTESTTQPPVLLPITITATTLPPTLPPVVITPTTIRPTLPPTTTIGPTLPPTTTIGPTLPPTTTIRPTLPPVTITPTTRPPATTIGPTLPPSTTAPPTTLPPTTTAPPTKKVIYPVVTNVPPTRKPALTTITGVRPARLLADALAAYRPPGAIEGDESGKERQNVWNEKSLRLKDALGL